MSAILKFRDNGGVYIATHPKYKHLTYEIRPFAKTLKVIMDGKVITGQNIASFSEGKKTANELASALVL